MSRRAALDDSSPTTAYRVALDLDGLRASRGSALLDQVDGRAFRGRNLPSLSMTKQSSRAARSFTPRFRTGSTEETS